MWTWWWRRWSTGQPLLLPADTFMESSVVTIYMYQLTRHEGTLRASPGDASVRIPRSELVVEHFQCMREICAGLGGIALGSRRTGIRPLAHLDCNGLACSTLRNNGAEHVIEGNVCDHGCIAQLHMASCPHRSLLAVGFPCQPFSLQGDRKGEWDPRTSAFWGSLRACWHLQASAMIMECVASVLQHPFIVQALHKLAALMGFQVKMITLRLQDQWPAKRDRWWAILASTWRSSCLGQRTMLLTPFTTSFPIGPSGPERMRHSLHSAMWSWDIFMTLSWSGDGMLSYDFACVWIGLPALSMWVPCCTAQFVQTSQRWPQRILYPLPGVGGSSIPARQGGCLVAHNPTVGRVSGPSVRTVLGWPSSCTHASTLGGLSPCPGHPEGFWIGTFV